MSIPILDLQAMVLPRLDSACRNWGFFALRGHELDPQLRRETFAQMQGFFQQPLAEKNRIRRSRDNCWGFYDAELTKNRRDWKEIVDIGDAASDGPLAGACPQWPQSAGFRECMESLQQQLHQVALQVVDALAASLQSHIDRAAAFDRHTSFLRLNYYPPCPQPAADTRSLTAEDGHLGISHHTDAGAVTVLMQDEHPGLQVYHRQRWHGVEPQPETLIINIGDVVQVWSNDRYPAPLHRVLADQRASRLSVPYFLNPDYAYNYAPLPDTGTPHYTPINWGEFRARRSAGDYADYGDEVQISDYRVAAEDA